MRIGSRRELFVDDFMIAQRRGLRMELHRPVPREIVLRLPGAVTGSNVSTFASVVQENGRFHFYYRAGRWARSLHRRRRTVPWFLCVAESRDGLTWVRPRLNLLPEASNAVLDMAMATSEFCRDRIPGATAVTWDDNPECPADERFKLLASAEGVENHGRDRKLHLYTSPDGRRFTQFRGRTAPLDILTNGDSQNTLFYDRAAGIYRVYHRIYDGPGLKRRAIYTSTSTDLEHFTPSVPLCYDDGFDDMALYTNCIAPYPRAPHLLLGFPMRYCDNGERWDMSIFNRPGWKERAFRGRDSRRGATTSTDTVFIAGRDGVHFRRYPEAFIRPGSETDNSWAYGDAAIAYGFAQTRSHLGNGAPDELSFYVVTGYRQSDCSSFRRHTLRLDGFVSLHAGADPGEMLSRPFIFDGGRLTLNVETSAWGHIGAELTDPGGRALPGYSLAECYSGSGDSTEMVMRWRGRGGDVRPLAGRVVRLRLVLRDADVYSFRFAPYAADPDLPEL